MFGVGKLSKVLLANSIIHKIPPKIKWDYARKRIEHFTFCTDSAS